MSTLLASSHYKARLAYGSRKDVVRSPEEMTELESNYRAAKLAEAVAKDLAAHRHTPEQLDHIIGILEAAKSPRRRVSWSGYMSDGCFDDKHGKCTELPHCGCDCHIKGTARGRE